MAYGMADRVREQNTFAGGTGAITLTGTAVSGGFQSFLSGWGASGTGEYCLRLGDQWETGFGTLNAGGTSLTRTTVYNGSSGIGVAVTFSSGTIDCFGDIPAELAHHLNNREITVPSASTCDIGAVAGSNIIISGTTTITSLGTKTNRRRFVRFSGALTLTYNATSLILPGAVNIVTVAGDTAIFQSDSSGNWRCVSYLRQGGLPVIQAAATIASATTTDLGSDLAQSITITGTTTITGFGSSAATGTVKFIKFSGALQITHNATSMILPGGVNITTIANDTMTVRHEGSGNWRCLSYQRTYAKKNPTRQTLTSGTGATYTTPTGCSRIFVRWVGGGGGSAANGTQSVAPTAGGDTTFNSIVAKGGAVGTQNGATGGAGGTGGSGSADLRIPGQSGGGVVSGSSSTIGGDGGSSMLGHGGCGTNGANGVAGVGYGAGGGGPNNASGNPGAGGGGGEYCELTINDPAATYTYTIGAAGTKGNSSSAFNGGDGAAGVVIVDEFYD
jgi:hypothetical protein